MSTDPENSKVAGESVSALEDNEMSNTTDPNVVPPFINSWAPLPSSAPATSAIGMNASLNLNMNLVSFYGNGSSVISGPPLLGGVLSNSNNGGNPPSLHSEYYSFPVPGNSNNQTMGSSGKASAGTSAGMNIPGPAEGLQRAHSNSFNGFTYNQGQPFNNNAGSLNTSQSGQPGGMGGNHIDFMNINSSPPLLSNASATSPGLYLSNMSNKGDNMNMMNHSNMFSNMHGILPTASGSYSNLINLNGVGNSNVNSSNNNSNSNNNNDGIASQQNTVGVKRLPVSTLSATTAAAVVAANKKAKANANAARARAASCSTAPDVPGQQNGAVSNTGGVATATTVNASRTTAPTVASAAGPQPASKVVTSSLQVSNAASSSVLSTTQSLPRTGGTGVGPTVARGGVGAQSGTQPSNAYFSANAPPSSMPQPSAANASSGPGAGVGVQPVGLNAAPQQPQQHQGALQHTHYPQQHPTQQQHMQSAAYATSTDRLSAVAAASGYYGAPPTDTRTTGTNAGYAHTQSGMHSSIQAQQAPQQLQHGMHPPQSFGGMTQPAGVQQGGLAQAGIHQLSQHSHLQNPSGLYVPGSTSQGIGSRTIGYIPQSTSSNNGGGGGECTVAYSNPAQQQQQQQGYAGVGTSTYSMQMQSGYHPGSSAGGAGNSGSYPQVPYHHGNQGQQQHAQAQQQAPHVPIYTPGVVPPNKTGVGAAPAKQARARATKPAKVVKKAPAVGGGNGLGGVHDGTDPGISGVGQDGATADGTTAVPARALTYKEKRAMSSKKALAAAAAAEAQRSGELPLSHRTDTDSKRRDSKKDKDGNTADGDKEKAEKEESLATLLRRREPIASRLEDMEDSKFLGRKGPVPPTPDLLPVPPAGAAPVFGGVVTTGTGGPLCTGSRRKTHWDYLLEEVQWMALDFRQELRWKMGAAKHTALACASLSSQCMVPRKLADSAAVTSVSSEVTSVSVAVPVRRSAADAQAARAVAGTLSRSVQSYWTALEEKVTSLSHQGANLRDFLRRVANQDITATDFFESSHGDDEDDEDEAEESSLNATCEPAAVPLDKVIDTILSVPALVAASPEVPKVEMCSSTITIASEKARTSHRKTRSPSSAREEPVTPAVSIVGADSGALPLQAHQRAAVSQVESLNNLNFGAMVCGRAYIGKTVACCSLIGQWLSASQSPAAVVSVVLLVGPRASEARWTAELLTVQFHGEIVVWDESVPSCVTSSVKAENASAGRILYVPDDVIAAFIKSPDFEALLAPTEVSSADPSLSSTCSLQGIFVDLRRMRCGSLQEDKQAVKHVQTSSSSSSCSLSLLSARVPATLTRRCVIREDSHSLENALETLCFLCPSTALPSWQAKFPTEAGAVSKKGAVRKGESGVSDAHLQQINRNTVTQLLVNLSVIVKLPSNADSVVAAQVGEIIIYFQFNNITTI